MIVRDALLGADTLFGRFELEGVVCYPSADNKSCCLSAKTDDDLVYLYVKHTPEEEYDGKEFGIAVGLAFLIIPIVEISKLIQRAVEKK